jgi:uncharacterized coiled-coil protein SlyX
MFSKTTRRRLDRLESKVADLDRFVDSRDYEHSLRRQVEQLREELSLLTQALGLVRVHAVVNRYESKEGPEQP